jgi:glycosyltransferase involved in cell wall biosynthesis
MTDALSVVIPAHDEAVLILPLLRSLAEDPGLEIVVVPNGCSDDTAAVARAVSSRIRVVEIAEASKVAALNSGDRAATSWPRVYIDADVTVTPGALRGLARALADEDKLVGSPRLIVDVAGSSWAVRAYYRVWELTDFRRTGHVGSGIYALTEDGRARFGDFPDLIADDLFVQTRFAPEERLGPIDASFTVHAPYTFRALMHRSERIALGNLQLASAEGSTTGSGAGLLVRRIAARPSLWLAFVVYCIGYAVPRRRARRAARSGAAAIWNRDETTRTVR